MHTAAEQLQFELAARLRDEIRDLKRTPSNDGSQQVTKFPYPRRAVRGCVVDRKDLAWRPGRVEQHIP